MISGRVPIQRRMLFALKMAPVSVDACGGNDVAKLPRPHGAVRYRTFAHADFYRGHGGFRAVRPKHRAGIDLNGLFADQRAADRTAGADEHIAAADHGTIDARSGPDMEVAVAFDAALEHGVRADRHAAACHQVAM